MYNKKASQLLENNNIKFKIKENGIYVSDDCAITLAESEKNMFQNVFFQGKVNFVNDFNPCEGMFNDCYFGSIVVFESLTTSCENMMGNVIICETCYFRNLQNPVIGFMNGATVWGYVKVKNRPVAKEIMGGCLQLKYSERKKGHNAKRGYILFSDDDGYVFDKVVSVKRLIDRIIYQTPFSVVVVTSTGWDVGLSIAEFESMI